MVVAATPMVQFDDTQPKPETPLVHQLQRAAPARLGEEVQHHVPQPGHLGADAGLLVLVLGRL